MSNLIQKISTLFKSPPPSEESSLNPKSQQLFSVNDQLRLKMLFDTLDHNSSARISHRDIENALLLQNIKFYDKRSYQKFYDHDLAALKTFTFSEFITLLSDLHLSSSDLSKLTNFDASLTCPKNPKGLQIQKADKFSSLPEISIEKRENFHDAINQLDSRRVGKLEFQDISDFVRSKIIPIKQADLNAIFEELDLKDNKNITLDSVILSRRTKKGTLYAHNLLVLAKGGNVSQDYASQIISLQDYSDTKQISTDDLLDLFQDFDLLDVDGSTVIKKDLLMEFEPKLKGNFSTGEAEAYRALLSLPSSQVNFNQFISLFQNFFVTFTFARKFYTFYISQNKSTTPLLDEDKSPLCSTNESFQSSSLAGKFASLDQISNISKKQGSLLSVSDNDQSDRPGSKTLIEQIEKPGSLQDEIDLKSPNNPSITTAETKIPAKSIQPDNQNGVNLRIGSRLSSNDDFAEKSSATSPNLPYSLGSLGDMEDPKPATKEILTIQRANSLLMDENEKLKSENTKLKEEVDVRETELVLSKEEKNSRIAELEDELAMQDNLVNRVKKEEQYTKEKLTEANEEILDLKQKVEETTTKFKKAGQEASQMKKRVAEKVKEILMQKEKIDATERLLNDKSREVEAMVRRKAADEKVYNDNITKMKGKLGYLTQKFTEYLTQNTSLQSELHQRNSAIKKMEAAFKDHMHRTEDQKSQLDFKIIELEKQLQSRSKSPEIQGFPLSPSVSHQKLFEKLNETLQVNAHLNHRCEEMRKDSALFKEELRAKLAHYGKPEDFAQTLAEQSDKVDGLTDTINDCQINKDIAKSLIESLKIQLDESKTEKAQLESKVQKMGDDLGTINMENIDLLSQVKEYKIELNYLHQCLNESLCNNANGSNDSMINIPNNEKADDLLKSQIKTSVEPSKELTVMNNHEIKDNLQALQLYIDTLKTWEEQTKALDEATVQINNKIQSLENIDSNKILEKEEAKKTLFEVYKKVIENKQLEASNLRRRVKEKTCLIGANIRMLSKLEGSFSAKLEELLEETSVKEKLVVQNNRLTQTIMEKNFEIERLRKEIADCKSSFSTPKSTADHKIPSSASASSHKMLYSSVGKSGRYSSHSVEKNEESPIILVERTKEKYERMAATMTKKLAGLEEKMKKLDKESKWNESKNQQQQDFLDQENIPENLGL
jgi:hypothetical protein